MLKAGIVGLPNVGKSTLFNALTESYQAESANYPFCTIEPNTGIVKLQDPRLLKLQELVQTDKVIPTVFEFVDIAGLVRGASKGEGLGNQFLANIREVDAVVHVVRCFEDENITHVDDSVDPVRDAETIQLELCMADVASLEKRMERLTKAIKQGDKEAMAQKALAEKVLPKLQEGEWINVQTMDPEDQYQVKMAQLLTGKPMIYAANLAEEDLADPTKNPHFMKLKEKAESEGRLVVPISAAIEAELISLDDPAEKAEYLESLGVQTSGVDALIRAAFQTLNMETYFTAGKVEVRAWPYTKGFKAPQCAGVIHTDFERGFICAEVIGFDDYVRVGGEKPAKEQGLMRQEGRDYLVKDGDVIHFRFNVSK